MNQEKTEPLTEARWLQIRDDYIDENLDPEREAPFTLKDVAARWKLNYGTLRNHASAGGWNDRLHEIVEQRNQKTQEIVQNSISYEEAEVRTRQARIARLAQDKATIALESIKPEDLSNREVIDLLRFSLEAERRALGMPDVHILEEYHHSGASVSPEEALQVAKDFVKALKGDEKVIEGEVLNHSSSE